MRAYHGWDDESFESVGQVIVRKNRAKNREPKQGKFWCMGCDAAEVHSGERCPNCGQRAGKHRKDK